jgi:hypothetical protein
MILHFVEGDDCDKKLIEYGICIAAGGSSDIKNWI